jgi:hypothetical protein
MDNNGNLIPDCNLANPAANGECGAITNTAFGTVHPNTTWDPAVTQGWGVRSDNWQISASIQQQLREGLALNVGYFRTWFGNFTVTDNVLTTPADYSTFCLTAPTDPRLPGGGGYQVCNLSDVVPQKFGLVQNVVTKASKFGNPEEHYNGVDATVNWRFGQGGLLIGGVNTGRKGTQCVAPNAPNPFCTTLEPWLTQLKLAGSYPLPRGVSFSAVFQSLPGVSVGGTANGTVVATNATLQPALGRPLSEGANGVLLIPIFSSVGLYEDRLNQLDLRVSKNIAAGRVRLRPQIDLYNVANAGTVLQSTPSFGQTFRLPRQVLGGRLLKFGATMNF